MTPSFSDDGSKLVYQLISNGAAQVRLRDMASGRDVLLFETPGRPKISHDGTRVAYSTGQGGNRPLYLIETAGGEPQKICDDCGIVYGWSPDSRKAIYWWGSPIRFSMLDITTRQKSDLMSHPKFNIHGAELSPDGRWLAFHVPIGARFVLYVTPVRDGRGAGENEWITVIDRGVQSLRPWWSPDGNILYFISNLDGFPCIWGQRLDSAKHPKGDPFQVWHFHGARHTTSWPALAPFGPANSRDQIVFSMSEVSGNIWLAEVPGR